MSKIRYRVVEKEGFGVQENPTTTAYTKDFDTKEKAEKFLDGYRKDKNLSWRNWETPYTYEIKPLILLRGATIDIWKEHWELIDGPLSNYEK